MKRFFAVVLAAVILALAGCEESMSSDAWIYQPEVKTPVQTGAEGVQLQFFGYKADAMNLIGIENAIHGFMDENPEIEVKYEGVKSTAYWEAFALRLDNGALDDIVMINHDYVLQLAPQGKLADLSGLPSVDGFSQMAKSQFTEKDGSVYFLPIAVSTYNLYINLDMLKENGFDEPGNWAEFSQQCEYFKAKGVTPVIGNNFATLSSLMSARSLYPVYQMENSAEMIEAFNSGQADIMEYLKDGVELVGTFLEKGWFDREELKNTDQTSDDLALFAQGDRPFMMTGGWASQRLMAMGPDFTYAIYPFPILETGSVLLMNVDTCISVSAQSEHPEQAKEFVNYLTQPDVIYEYCDTQSCYTPLEDDRTPSDQTIVPAAEYLLNGQSVIGADYRLKLPLDNAEKAVAAAMLDGMSTQDALALLRELIDP